MSSLDMHDAVFKWPHLEPSDVIVTGSFDGWSRTIHLSRTSHGFATTVKVPWGQKVSYKYIVDGRWTTTDTQPTELDPIGNINNVYNAPARPAQSRVDAPAPIPPSLHPVPILQPDNSKGESTVTVDLPDSVPDAPESPASAQSGTAEHDVAVPSTTAKTESHPQPTENASVSGALPRDVSDTAPTAEADHGVDVTSTSINTMEPNLDSVDPPVLNGSEHVRVTDGSAVPTLPENAPSEVAPQTDPPIPESLKPGHDSTNGHPAVSETTTAAQPTPAVPQPPIDSAPNGTNGHPTKVVSSSAPPSPRGTQKLSSFPSFRRGHRHSSSGSTSERSEISSAKESLSRGPSQKKKRSSIFGKIKELFHHHHHHEETNGQKAEK